MVEYEGITALLLQVVPELGPKYLQFIVEREQSGEIAEASPSEVFEEMLVPFVIQLVSNKPTDAAKSLASRIFAFLEQLSISTDDEIRRLIERSICLRLVDDRGTQRSVRPFMGPNIREKIDAALTVRRVGTESTGPAGSTPDI